MKIRVKPLVLTLVGSMAVLFGGWFFYQNVAVQSPVEKVAKEVSTVSDAKANITRNDVQLVIQVQPDANLREIVQHIYQSGNKVIGEKKLNITVSNPSSPLLDDWWSHALFGVAQAMENKQYSEIPQVLEKTSKSLNLTQVHTSAEMDERNVYVTITDGKASKYIILPRKGEPVGVWPNA